MFASSYFGDRYFAPRYFPKVGAGAPDPPLGGSDAGGYVAWQTTVITAMSLCWALL